MIEIKNITKNFGKLEVLKGIDLSINDGEIVSIVGPSGAGKSTLQKILFSNGIDSYHSSDCHAVLGYLSMCM